MLQPRPRPPLPPFAPAARVEPARQKPGGGGAAGRGGVWRACRLPQVGWGPPLLLSLPAPCSPLPAFHQPFPSRSAAIALPHSQHPPTNHSHLPLPPLNRSASGPSALVSADALAEMRSRLIAGLKRYFHSKRMEGLLSGQVGAAP